MNLPSPLIGRLLVSFLLGGPSMTEYKVQAEQLPASAQLLNIDFGFGEASAEVGFAAVGKSDSDFWNIYSFTDEQGATRSSGEVRNLRWSDQTESGSTLAVSNAGAVWGFSSSDPMYGAYLFPEASGGNITVTLIGLPTGKYDVYVYGHGDVNEKNGAYSLTVGGADYGIRQTTTGSEWNSTKWAEGQQYILFRSVALAVAGQQLVLTAQPGLSGVAVINGMQLLRAEPAGDTVAPTTPADVAAKAASPSRVDLTWSPSTDTGGSGLAFYRVYRDGQQLVTTASANYSDSGLSPETHYCYSVMACDNAGHCSELSQEACVVMPTRPEPTPSAIFVGYTIPVGVLPLKSYALEQTTDLGGRWATAQWPVMTDALTERAQIPFTTGGNLSFRVSVSSPYDLSNSFLSTNTDLQDLIVGYDTNNWKSTALRILNRICPDAEWVADKAGVNFFFWFQDASSFGSIAGTLSTAVHESVHTVGDMQSGTLRGLCLGEDSFLYFPHVPNAPRSEIGPALPAFMQGVGYYTAYLTGGSGGQDFVSLLGELNAYTFTALIESSLAGSLPQGSGRNSTRDGLLTMMLYTEIYLRICREQHAEQYNQMDNQFLDSILVLWASSPGSDGG